MGASAAAVAPGELEPQLERAAAIASGAGDSWAVFEPAKACWERLRADWLDLAAHAAEPNVFAEHWFARAGLENLPVPPDVNMMALWSGTPSHPTLIGLLPVHISRSYGRMPVRHVQNWGHSYGFLGTPLVRAGSEQAFWSGVLTALDEEKWARSFLHMKDLVEDGPVHRGLAVAAASLGRPCDIVHRSERALLASSLSPEDYYQRTVRKKKRKELKRLTSRLAELGTVASRTLSRPDEIGAWCDAFLALERSGWKGEAGSALACSPPTELFFRQAIAGAFAAGQLDFLSLELDRRPIAMLVNFIAPPGSFSFKIAFDQDYARFSPGVLIQLQNLRILERGDVDWMDSCAAENHPMINSLWAERRQLVRVTVPLAGTLRRATFRFCRTAENASAALRLLRNPALAPQDATDDE